MVSHGGRWAPRRSVGGRSYVPLTKSPTSGKLCELPRDLELSKDMLIGLAQRGGRAGGGGLDDDTSCLLQKIAIGKIHFVSRNTSIIPLTKSDRDPVPLELTGVDEEREKSLTQP